MVSHFGSSDLEVTQLFLIGIQNGKSDGFTLLFQAKKSPFICFLEKYKSQIYIMARHQTKKMSAATLYRITSLASLRPSQSNGENILTEDSSLAGTLVESAFSMPFSMRPIFISWDHYHCSVLLQDMRKSFRHLWQPVSVAGLTSMDYLFQKAYSHQRNNLFLVQRPSCCWKLGSDAGSSAREIWRYSSADKFNIIVHFREEIINFHFFSASQFEAEQERFQGPIVRGKQQFLCIVLLQMLFVLGNKHI